jgi:hypothetical protein
LPQSNKLEIMRKTAELGSTAERLDFGEILEKLAINMRAYDQLVEQRKSLIQSRDERAKLLEDLDLDKPLSIYEPQIAYSALGYVIAQTKLDRVKKSIDDLQFSYTDRLHFLYVDRLAGVKVELAAVDPEKYRLDAFIPGENLDRHWLGKEPASKKGKITDINLDPQYGGWIEIHGRFNSYCATGLIDREADYSPAFSIAYTD